MQGGAEEEGLHPVLATTLDLSIELRDVLSIIFFLQIVSLVKHQELYLAHVELFAADIIHRLLQGANTNVDTIFKLTKLLRLSHAPHEETGLDLRVDQILAKLRYALKGLLCEVSRWLKDHAHRQALTFGYGFPLRPMRGVKLPYRSVLLYRVLQGAIELAGSHKAFPADMWFQAYILELRRQLECNAEVSPVLEVGDALQLAIEQATNDVPLLEAFAVVIKFSVPTLLARGAKSKALLLHAQLEDGRRGAPTHTQHAFHHFHLVHVLALENLKGGTDSKPLLVVGAPAL
mmetsp:Transcript_81117/g.173503  ORF Transcript_81117/g.173503 Transcript_81117/m.173503 type:complete len:290 (-) Transcript_81117:398-1267(-)